MHEIFSQIMRTYSQSYLIKFVLLVCTSRPVGQIRTLSAVGGAKASAASVSSRWFPESGGRSLAVVVAPPLEPLTRESR